MLVTLKYILHKAQAGKYAVGAFNVNNMETCQAVIEAAVECASPVIMQTSEAGIEYAGMDYLVSMITLASKSSMPVVLHLDHGKDFEIIRRALRYGYSSVMYDGSLLPFEENMHRTTQIVRWAKQFGASVEAELGAIAGVEDLVDVKMKQVYYTNPKEAQEFVQKTGCDALAVSIGTAHGIFKSKKGAVKLDFERLGKIAEVVHIPLVLHGASSVSTLLVSKIKKYGGKIEHASGVSDEQLKRAVALGICKVNTDSDLRLAFTAGVREMIAKDFSVIDPRKILGSAKIAMKQEVQRKIKLLGSCGKA